MDVILHTEVSGQLQQLAWLPNSVQQLFLWRFLLLSTIMSFFPHEDLPVCA